MKTTIAWLCAMLFACAAHAQQGAVLISGNVPESSLSAKQASIVAANRANKQVSNVAAVAMDGSALHSNVVTLPVVGVQQRFTGSPLLHKDGSIFWRGKNGHDGTIALTLGPDGSVAGTISMPGAIYTVTGYEGGKAIVTESKLTNEVIDALYPSYGQRPLPPQRTDL